MNAGQLAALIAAIAFAVLAGAAVVVLLRLARLLTAAGAYLGRADRLIERAQAAVDRTNEQLDRTDTITASMDQVTANMAELTGHVSALTGLARGISALVTAPLGGTAAFLFGLRRAIAVRRAVQAVVVSPAAAAAADRAPGETAPAVGTGQPGNARGEAGRR